MKKPFRALTALLTLAALTLSMAACSGGNAPVTNGDPVEAGIIVPKVEDLSEDFIMGADISSLISLEQSGVKFYDFDGNEADCLAVLAGAGVNMIRVRVWNDPFDANGNGYGGGNCNIDTAIELGRRAAALGMGILVDLHYSDFWADPSKQQAPKAWEGMSMEEKTQAIYDYTADCLTKLSEAGVDVAMVQIGNETTTGMAGEESVPRVTQLMASAAQAIRDTAPETKIVVHYTNAEDGKYSLYAASLDVNGVDYDVFASSWYPYWHGTLDNLMSQLQTVAEKYGKQVLIAETSWAHTLEDGDEHGNTIGEQLTYEKPYPFTVQGQARELYETIAATAALGEAGLGVFYWEPAWIGAPVSSYEERVALWEKYGSGWASSYSADYDPDDAGIYYGGSACDNQALFSFDGKPLESLKTFSYVYTGTVCPVTVDTVEPCYITVRRNNPITLPDTVDAVYNDGTTAPAEVVWEETDLAALSASPVGIYEVKGTASGMPVSLYVSVADENYIENYSFEDTDYSMWVISETGPGGQTDFQNKKTDAYSGTVSLHFFHDASVEFTVEQTVENLRQGTYNFSIRAQGGDVGSDAEMYIYAIADGQRYEASFAVDGWVNWQHPILEGIECTSGQMTVGVYIRTAGGGWGTLDEFLLNPVE